MQHFPGKAHIIMTKFLICFLDFISFWHLYELILLNCIVRCSYKSTVRCLSIQYEGQPANYI
jgi:hypothetical protein